MSRKPKGKKSTSSLSKECQLRRPVEVLFPEEQYFVRTEVPFGLKRIDMVFKEKTNGRSLIAVELKVKDWKRAVWQAVQNRQVATYSYIALPEGYASAVDTAILGSLGLGLIVSGTRRARVGLRAKKSPFVNKRIANEISHYIEHSSNV